MDMDMEVQGNNLASYLDRSSYSFFGQALVSREKGFITHPALLRN